MTDVIVPMIQASLKDLPIGKSGYIFTAKHQSIASKDQKGVGKWPDVMFIASCNNRSYELIYGESSRIICDEQKKENDRVKTWREMNDGMYWAHKGCKPDKDDFGIIGIQIAGTEMHLNILIRGMDEIHRFYNLRTVEIPIQPTNGNTVFKFVETLLTIRVCEMQFLYFTCLKLTHTYNYRISCTSIYLFCITRFQLVQVVIQKIAPQYLLHQDHHHHQKWKKESL